MAACFRVPGGQLLTMAMAMAMAKRTVPRSTPVLVPCSARETLMWSERAVLAVLEPARELRVLEAQVPGQVPVQVQARVAERIHHIWRNSRPPKSCR